ncbi:MAG: BsuPI-related putative proteinase inhibitor [Dehalococcoidia bacterium]
MMSSKKKLIIGLSAVLLLMVGMIAGCDFEEELNGFEQAKLEVSNLSITPEEIQEGGSVTLAVDVTNTGDEVGTKTLVFKVNGKTESREVTAEPGATMSPAVTFTMDKSGIYEASVDGLTGNFEVVRSAGSEIIATAGAGGNIDPEGKIEISHGLTQEFAIMPEEGYTVADVLVDGESVGAVAKYRFEDVAEDHNIHAEFEQENGTEVECENPYSPGLILLVATVDEVPHGASLPMAMVVTTSAYEQTHHFNTSQRYDFSIYDENGEEVWRWSDDQAFLMVTGEETYTTDGVLYFERMHTAELPSEPAKYMLKATLTTEGSDDEKEGPADTCIIFEVIPG